MKVGSFERASKITTNKKNLNEISQAVTEWQTFQFFNKFDALYSIPENMGFKKKSPVYLKGEAVQSRNHSSVTIKFKFIEKLKRLPFGNRLTDFIEIFLLVVIFEALSNEPTFIKIWEGGWTFLIFLFN